MCTGYKLLDGKVVDLLPMGADEVSRCEPIYETLPGWSDSTFGVKALVGIPIDIVSTGPERDETILKRHPFA
jgi:adenylosuccinate synthase